MSNPELEIRKYREYFGQMKLTEAMKHWGALSSNLQARIIGYRFGLTGKIPMDDGQIRYVTGLRSTSEVLALELEGLKEIYHNSQP